MKRDELKKWMKDSTELRQYDQHGQIDGNFNYIHRTKVGNLVSKQLTRIETLEAENKMMQETLEEIRSLHGQTMDGYDACFMASKAEKTLRRVKEIKDND